MALPTVVINSSGSDTAASGAGPTTALSGTAAATASSTTVTLSVDAPDLSGVATDGSAVIWVGSSSGRQFAKITATDNILKTVTVSDAYDNTESGKNWGIGGKRATLNGSLQLGPDCRAGWTIDLQTNDTLTANFNLKPNAVAGTQTTFKSTTGSAVAGTGVQLSTSTNSVWGVDTQNANNIQIRNIYFKSTAGTPGDGIGPAGSGGSASDVAISGCVIDGFRNGITGEDNGNNVQTVGLVINGCEVKNCTGRGVWVRQKGATLTYNFIHNNTGRGGDVANGQGVSAMSFCFNVFDNNGNSGGTGSGLQVQSNQNTYCTILNNAFSNNTGTNGHGLYLNTTTPSSFVVRNNISYGNNGTNAVDVNADSNLINAGVFDYNAYGTSSGSWVTGANDVTLTANPFISSTDWGLNSTGGGGAACKAVGANAPNASANAAPDLGPIPSGGGAVAGGPVETNFRGGFSN